MGEARRREWAGSSSVRTIPTLFARGTPSTSASTWRSTEPTFTAEGGRPDRVGAVSRRTPHISASSGQQLMVNFRVSDLDAMLAQLRAAGCRGRRPCGGRSSTDALAGPSDLEGNRFELWERRLSERLSHRPTRSSSEQLEEELKTLKVSDLLVQTLYTVSSLGYRRLSEQDRDLDQARLAIEALRALVPVLERSRERGARAGLQAGDGEPPARVRGRRQGRGLNPTGRAMKTGNGAPMGAM